MLRFGFPLNARARLVPLKLSLPRLLSTVGASSPKKEDLIMINNQGWQTPERFAIPTNLTLSHTNSI